MAKGKYMDAMEASKVFGSSYSHVIALINQNKIRAKRHERRWFIETKEVQRVKDAGIVRTRKKRGSLLSGPDQVVINIDKERMNLIQAALGNKTIEAFLQEKVDALYDQIKKQLSGLHIKD